MPSVCKCHGQTPLGQELIASEGVPDIATLCSQYPTRDYKSAYTRRRSSKVTILDFVPVLRMARAMCVAAVN